MADPVEDASRRAFLTLLRTDKEVREEMGRLILESAVMQELRALREDTNRRFEELRADMDKRFEELRADMDKRFEELRADMDRRFEAQAAETRALRQDMSQGFKEVRDLIASLGGRWGIQNEEAVRQFATEYIAREFGVKAERWRRGDAEVDVVIHNGDHHLIEVTACCDEKHLDRFLKTARAYERATKKRAARRIVITPHASGKAWQRAFSEGVEILSG